MAHNFPPLPVPLPEQPWPPHVLAAAQGIQTAFVHALECFDSPNLDAIRLSIQLENMANNCVPLLEALALSENLPAGLYDWLYAAALACDELVNELLQAHTAARGM